MTVTVGRDRELGVLSDALGLGGTRVVLVRGAAGMGKTRLVAETLRMAKAQGLATFSIRAYQPEQSAPLLASARVLASLADRDPSLAELLARQDPAGMALLFDRAYRALRSAGRVVLLTIDDEQWLDPTSRSLVEYVVRSGKDDHANLIVMSAGRPSREVVAFEHALGAADGLELRTLHMVKLEREPGVSLVRSVARSLDAAQAEQVWRSGDGSYQWAGFHA